MHVSEFYGFLLKVNRLSAAIEFQPNLLWKIDNVLYFMSYNNFVDRIHRAVSLNMPSNSTSMHNATGSIR